MFGGDIAYAANGTPIYDSIVPTMLAGLPDILLGIVVVLVLSASMSTLAGLVLTSSSTLTLDLIKGNIVKKMSEKKQVRYMRFFIVVFVAISAGTVPFDHRVHRSVDGLFVGRAFGFVPWSLFLGLVLRSHLKASSLV